ncbi:AAA family ATPase [Jiulongibacter sp. NS-SX5]|uniref:AAA family ATPase n=1 Tax=Jiulongibacter sp. NS-SX5 TaxID=3463854 RepID=UPI0040591403
MSRYNLTTENGYDFFECSSALQKSIRRGLEEEAMFWAVELFNSNYQEYVWKRLKIISSEDIGLANPTISSEVQALYEMHKEQAKKKDDKNMPQRLFLTHAVLMMCRSKKSRTVDWALIYHWGCHNNNLRAVPDFALDKHNERGRKLGRSWNHFFEEGTLLSDEATILTEEEYKAKAKGAIRGTCGNGLFD